MRDRFKYQWAGREYTYIHTLFLGFWIYYYSNYLRRARYNRLVRNAVKAVHPDLKVCYLQPSHDPYIPYIPYICATLPTTACAYF